MHVLCLGITPGDHDWLQAHAGDIETVAVMRMIERLVTKDEAEGGDLGPNDPRAVLRAWLEAVELDVDEQVLLAHLQADGFSHAALERRARRCHERKLAVAVAQVSETADWNAVAAGVFEACVAALPYAPVTAVLARERERVHGREPMRVAVVADGLGAVHGVTTTLAQIRERGVPGFEVEVIGTDASVDRRLSAVAEADVPFYPGLTVGVPSVPAVVDALADGGLFLFCSQTDTFGQVILEAQASGLPVVAVAAGGPAELVADGRSGVLCPPRVEDRAGALVALAGSRTGRRRLARGGLAAVAERSWEASLVRLAAGWRRALAVSNRNAPVAVAPPA